MSAKRSGGLGRGLDALLPKATDKGPSMVPLDKLRPAAGQPRRRFDPQAIAELTASIAEKGVLQPLLVRPKGDYYEIVAGERRYRAASAAGLGSVPVVIREFDDRQALEVAIVENLQREDLTPVEEARAFQQLLELGASQEEVGRAVGKSRSAVANAIRLLGLPEDALRAIENGQISAGHARAILAQPEEDRSWALAQIVERDLNVREAESLRRVRVPRRSASDGRYRNLEEELSRHAGTRVRVSGGRRGKIELHFHSEEELHRLLELLGYQP